jgi:hypothetical protein
MKKTMENVLAIDFERMKKDPPLGYSASYKIMLDDLFLRELSDFNIDLKEHESKYEKDIERDSEYLTQKIVILLGFAIRCKIYKDILNEDLNSLEVATRLV